MRMNELDYLVNSAQECLERSTDKFCEEKFISAMFELGKLQFILKSIALEVENIKPTDENG